jgi:hypothetical protein
LKTLFQKTEILLQELHQLVTKLSDEQFITQISELHYASIGQHLRHILEFFQCLIQSQETQKVDYDTRKRNPLIENNRLVCLEIIQEILENVEFQNINLTLFQSYNVGGKTEKIEIPSNYFREWAYNLEHTIHHQALIKVGVALLNVVLPNSSIDIAQNFGVADATINFKNQQKNLKENDNKYVYTHISTK